MTDTPRRVLMLVNGVDDTFGGSLRAVVNLSEAMADDGVSVTVSAPVVRGRAHRTLDLMDVRIDRRLFAASRPVARFGGSFRQFRWLWRHLRSFDEVQVHLLFSLSAVYGVVIAAMRGVPVFLWPHGSLLPEDLRKHARVKQLIGPLVTRRLLNRCVALLFTTTRESRIAVTYGSRAPHEVVPLPVVPLSVGEVDGAAWRRRYGVPDDVPIVLFLGRIDYKKRLPLLVETLSLLTRRDAHLVVVGDGPDSERALVDETATRCGVTDRLHVTGWLEGADRIEAFAVADVFALLSEFENFGLAVVEAISVGCPVVISEGVYLAEDLKRARAAVCVDRDAAAAAKEIDALLAQPDHAAAMGQRGRELVAREFAPTAVAARLREVSSKRVASHGRVPAEGKGGE